MCALVWIASKYNEETIVLANFAYSQDPDTFKKKIIACERQVLDALEFDLNYTSPGELIEEICKARGIGILEQQCAQALCTRQCIRWDGEVTDARFLAAASLVIARYYQSTGGEWQGKREEMLRIVKEDVGVNAEELAAHCAENLHTTYRRRWRRIVARCSRWRRVRHRRRFLRAFEPPVCLGYFVILLRIVLKICTRRICG